MSGPAVYAPVPRTSVSQSVYERLRAAILGGDIAAGDALPSERLLSEEFGVNRHAVREALKRLEQAQLVQVTHGGATRARDWRREGGLDLLALLPFVQDELPDVAMVRSMLEMRVCVGADAARRCAERDGARRAAGLRARSAQVAAAGDDLADRNAAYIALWEAIVDGSANVAYRLAFNSLIACAAAMGEPLRELHAHEMRDDRRRDDLVAAIAAADGPRAETIARELLKLTLDAAPRRAEATARDLLTLDAAPQHAKHAEHAEHADA